MRAYFLTSITMPDPQTGDMMSMMVMMSSLPVGQLALDSCEFHSKTIFKMELYVKCVLFPYFLCLFWALNMILSDALILPVSQLQTQQVMTSQIRSHIEYLMHTYRILFSDFVVEIDEKSSHNGGFQYDLMMIIHSGLLFWATLYCWRFCFTLYRRPS